MGGSYRWIDQRNTPLFVFIFLSSSFRSGHCFLLLSLWPLFGDFRIRFRFREIDLFLLGKRELTDFFEAGGSFLEGKISVEGKLGGKKKKKRVKSCALCFFSLHNKTKGA